MEPTSGSGTIGPSGGKVATRDQPFAQAEIAVPAGALAATTAVEIIPSAPPPPSDVTLTGNVYCFNAARGLVTGSTATVTLLVPVYQPFPEAIYVQGPHGWSSIGGSVDQSTYLMSARTTAFGCFATGYKTPKPGAGPTIGGSTLPLLVAVLIAVVVLAGLPLALRRRRG